jgi:4-hydroxythreonine-4-phosphate dehydrogenase
MTPIGITMGDPAGVGPEIIVKSMAALSPDDRLAYRIFGNAGSLAAAERVLGTGLDIASLDLHQTDIPGDVMPFGKLDERGGEACFRFIEAAVRQAESGEIAGIVTAPINKAALNAAGHHYDGHTGMLASLTGAKSSFMLLTSERLNVIHVSTHISLKGAIDRARTDRILQTIRAGQQQFLRLGITPRIAVAGLNPHAGEGGAMGWEEVRMIRPLIARLASEGLAVTGPWSADTMFHAGARAGYDAAVCAYHDQALIPIKTIDFAGGVNVTLGLPFVRTSPDHGTAYDIAGKGLADPSSLIAALRMAQEMAAARP